MANPYAQQLKTVIFDIETMGLRPMHDMIISASFIEPESDEVFQLFTASPGEEERIIRDIYGKLAEYDVVVTYNGNSFDLPFIETRAKKYGIQNIKPRFWAVDLYRYLKKYWPMAKSMPHLNQKSVEAALGFSDARDDKIGGGECIPLYNEYLQSGDSRPKEVILLHNGDDVRQLRKIYNACVFLPYDKIAFEQGFAVKNNGLVMIESMRMDGRGLYVKASRKPGGIPSSIYDDFYQLEYDCFTGKIELELYTSQKEGLAFVDLAKLPIDSKYKEDLKELKGYFSDYLILSDHNGENVNYREVNSLIGTILRSEGLF